MSREQGDQRRGDVDWVAAPDPDRALEDVRALFAQVHGGEPAGVWAAPGRVNLIGEHVDYAGGTSLPLALPHRTLVAVRPREDGRVRVVSAWAPEDVWEGSLADVRPGTGGRAGTVPGWPAYPAGVLWALGPDAGRGGVGPGWDVPGVDLAVTSDVPVGAGLSSSAALTCSTALAVADLVGQGTHEQGTHEEGTHEESTHEEGTDEDALRRQLVAACVRAENEVAGSPTGGMDQQASLRARAQHLLLLDSADGSVEHVPLALEEHGLVLLVVDTRAPHRLVDGQYADRRAGCARAAELLGVPHLARAADTSGVEEVLDRLRAASAEDDVVRRARHVLTEEQRTRALVDLLRQGRPQDVGPLLDGSHASLRDDHEVSSPELDVVTDAARAAGALGARMTGGGFGGSAVALVREGDVDAVARAVTRASAEAGHPRPQLVSVVAAGGAERLA
ncbi:galactokinase family protein [uncultured Pseudokineococcus sp.]|uniref:galactokinase n=1 Tax=uncultured Pseudokineococcus sp. TaxID=1642928 RepID=UPI002626BEE7|nr:galactokinase family protein [uncultured Pseudokineococcus sp.]